MALENPRPDPKSPGMLVLPLSEADAIEIEDEIVRILDKTPNALPSGLVSKLHSLSSIRGQLWYIRPANDLNRALLRRLDTVREIEAAIDALMKTPSGQTQTIPPAPVAPAATKASAKSGKRGRPVKGDPNDDQRLWDGWVEWGRRNMKGYAREQGRTLKKVSDALERVRVRNRRKSDSSRTKSGAKARQEQ
jgi:hypothetical protein